MLFDVALAHAEAYPAQSFPSKDAAVASATKAFAGGSFQELDVAKKKVLVLYRYASGAFSSDAAIYYESKGHWQLITYYAPILNDSIEASAEGSRVVLKAHQKKQVLLTVSVAPETQEAEPDGAANGRQPVRSETNSTLPEDAPRR
jgi:hypothetical protein